MADIEVELRILCPYCNGQLMVRAEYVIDAEYGAGLIITLSYNAAQEKGYCHCDKDGTHNWDIARGIMESVYPILSDMMNQKTIGLN